LEDHEIAAKLANPNKTRPRGIASATIKTDKLSEKILTQREVT
jgi:hypothetical protein